MSIKDDVKQLKEQINEVVFKEECECGKTLFFYDEEFIYIKCKGCGKIDKFKRMP